MRRFGLKQFQVVSFARNFKNKNVKTESLLSIKSKIDIYVVKQNNFFARFSWLVNIIYIF